MKRDEFFIKIIRYLLLSIVAAVIVFLGNKITTGKDCNVCPDNGVCSGKSYCNKY